MYGIRNGRAGLCAVMATTLFGTGVASAGGLSASWSQLTPYPTPITNNAVAGVCEPGPCTIYSFMGLTDPSASSSITASSYKLVSPGNGPWTPIADAPLLDGKAKIAASAVTCNGEVYLIGGYTVGGTEVTEHRLFRYDAIGDTYVQLADVPTEVDDTVATVYQNRYIFLISGWHGPINNNTQAVQVYDTVTNVWQQATPIPTNGRFGHAGGLVGDRLVFIDGAAGSFGFPIVHDTHVGQIDPGDITSVTWTDEGANPFSATYRAANSLGASSSGLLVFLGGTDNPYNFNGTGYNGQPSNPLDLVMAYDPIGNAWQQIDDTAGAAHTPTMDHRGLVPFDGGWVTVGGMTGPGAATDAVNMLTISEPVPATSTWALIAMAAIMVVFATRILRRQIYAFETPPASTP